MKIFWKSYQIFDKFYKNYYGKVLINVFEKIYENF